jgi:thiamine pyrophosphate-dependent acetolactate synthase large subunit-like protein
MAKNVSETLLDILADAGVSDIFGVTGDALNTLLEAIRKDSRFRWIGVRHEENAAYAAYAQAELSDGLGVCAGTVGPGSLHLINGLYNAKKEGAAVLAITGQVAHHQRGSNYFQEVDLSRMFDDICSYQAIINTPDQLPRLAEIAIQKALGERSVVRLELPVDVIAGQVNNRHFLHPLVHTRSAFSPPEQELEKATQIIQSGKRISLFCGVGCREAKNQVLQLSQKLNAPIVHTVRSKDIFDYSDPNVVGMTGMIGNPGGYHAVWDCDVLIMLGTNFPYDGFIPDGIQIIQVDSQIENIGRRAPVSLGLLGTAKETLEALLPKIIANDSDKFLHHTGILRDKWLQLMDRQADLSRVDEPLHPQLFAKQINDQASDDAIFGVDVGEVTVWFARHIRMGGGRRLLGSFNHGSLGAGLPVALGACSLYPQKQVWALCGDGGFAMSMQDFVTAVRYQWPIKVIVFNNSELGFVKMETEVSGLPLNPEATGLLNPDFAEFARCCGGEGVRVEHAADIAPAIQQAINSKLPFIIDAIVSPGELTMPPNVSVDSAWGFGLSKVKEGLLGFKGEHEQWRAWRDEFKANIF